MTSKAPAEASAKKRGRPKKADVTADEGAIEKKTRQSKTTANGKKASKAKEEQRLQKSWEDIAHRADDQLRASQVTISSVGSILSKRRSVLESVNSTRFPLPHATAQPQLRAQAASMSTKTTSSKKPSSAKARVIAQQPKATAPNSLPPGYNKAARQWTGIVVSIPIVLMSSYWVYERLVLGKEQKMTVGNVLEKWFPDPDEKKNQIPAEAGQPEVESSTSKEG